MPHYAPRPSDAEPGSHCFSLTAKPVMKFMAIPREIRSRSASSAALKLAEWELVARPGQRLLCVGVGDNSLQTHVPHQSRHRATGNVEAFALELAPDLGHARRQRSSPQTRAEPRSSTLRPAWHGPTAWLPRAAWLHGSGRSRARSAITCRWARPHTPTMIVDEQRSWLGPAVELRRRKIGGACLAEDLVVPA